MDRGINTSLANRRRNTFFFSPVLLSIVIIDVISRLQPPQTTKVFTNGPHKPLILLVNCFSLLYSPAKALLLLLLLFLLRAGRERCEVTYDSMDRGIKIMSSNVMPTLRGFGWHPYFVAQE